VRHPHVNTKSNHMSVLRQNNLYRGLAHHMKIKKSEFMKFPRNMYFNPMQGISK